MEQGCVSWCVQYLIFNLQRRGGDLTEMRERWIETHIIEVGFQFHARHTECDEYSAGNVDTINE